MQVKELKIYMCIDKFKSLFCMRSTTILKISYVCHNLVNIINVYVYISGVSEVQVSALT